MARRVMACLSVALLSLAGLPLFATGDSGWIADSNYTQMLLDARG